MNKWVGCGNITKDLEIRKTNTGKSVLDFSIACNEGKTKDGNDIVDFVNVQAWERQAETIEQYLNKGSKILIEGKLKTTSYDGQNGKVYRTFVLLDRFEFVGGKANNTNQPQKGEYEPLKGHEEPNESCGPIDIDSEALPFY